MSKANSVKNSQNKTVTPVIPPQNEPVVEGKTTLLERVQAFANLRFPPVIREVGK